MLVVAGHEWIAGHTVARCVYEEGNKEAACLVSTTLRVLWGGVSMGV